MNTDNHKTVVVIGVGNRALSDEGVGCRIAREVAATAPAWVEVIDAGLPGPELPDLMKGRRKAVIVDAVDAGRPPGTVCRFRLDEIAPTGADPYYSLHQGGVSFYVKLAEAVGMCADDVVIIGVQPESFSPGEELSASVEKAVEAAAALVVLETCSPGAYS